MKATITIHDTNTAESFAGRIATQEEIYPFVIWVFFDNTVIDRYGMTEDVAITANQTMNKALVSGIKNYNMDLRKGVLDD